MKKLLPLFVFTVLLTYLGFGQSRKYDHTIRILDNVVPTENCKVKDVFVVRENDMYKVLFYGKQDNQVHCYKASVSTGTYFSAASYSWVGGKKVAIRLFDEISTNAFECKVFGLRCGSGIEFEIEDDAIRQN